VILTTPVFFVVLKRVDDLLFSKRNSGKPEFSACPAGLKYLISRYTYAFYTKLEEYKYYNILYAVL